LPENAHIVVTLLGKGERSEIASDYAGKVREKTTERPCQKRREKTKEKPRTVPKKKERED